MEDAYKIIKRPLITEKSTIIKEMHNQLAFEVDRRANKIEIKKAVERIFKVQVEDVRTMNYQGKRKRLGPREGRRRHWKKAVVTLKPGQKIEFFEGV
ncbi:MAG: 50S ribosomal protein L23 [Deltaproteobacteria bacterium]|jgi:large subunit ribosomal protein L23|nr:50S ribosomal protein L23 [Deltaproteobacteria bacterium]